MKICNITDNISLYDINNIVKFDIVKDNLVKALEIMDDHQVLSGIPITEYYDILRKQLETSYNKFKLLVALNKEKDVVAYIAAFIAIHENQKPVCLIYGAYFFPMLLRPILPVMLKYLDIFSTPFGCKKTIFSTSRSETAYTELFKRSDIGFKPTHTVFERDIEYE